MHMRTLTQHNDLQNTNNRHHYNKYHYCLGSGFYVFSINNDFFIKKEGHFFIAQIVLPYSL